MARRAAHADLDVLAQAVRSCFACRRMDYCHVLSGANGGVRARVMFVGEAPGRFGAGRSGVPFSGDEAGRRFEALLAHAGLSRSEVFVTNAVLCNPLDSAGRNRRPLTSEVMACLAHLRAQVDALQPGLVVALGGVALDALGRIESHGLRLAADCSHAGHWYGRRLMPLYHTGRRALVHRSEVQQQTDWRALGVLVAGMRE